MKSYFLNFFKKYSEYQHSALIYIIYLLLVILFPFLLFFLKIIYFSSNPLVYLFFWGSVWDGKVYLTIATSGYYFPHFAFFPGYPLFLKFLQTFLPSNYLSLINFVLTFFTTLSIYRFLRLLGIESRYKNRVLVLFLTYPTSFFLISNYVESLYILLSIWILTFLVEKKYTKFYFLGFLLSFLKITSIALPVVYISHLIKEKTLSLNLTFPNLSKFLKHLLLSFTLIGGIIIYFGLLQIFFGSYRIYFESQNVDFWRRDPLVFNLNSTIIDPSLYFVRLSELFIFILLTGLFINYQKKLRLEFYVFSLVHFLLPVLTGTLLSLNRLSLLCFPILLVFFGDLAKNNSRYYLYLIAFIIWQLLGIFGLFNFIFVG